MKFRIQALGMGLACLIASSCASDGPDEVYSAISARLTNDGKLLSVHGLLKTNAGYYNLYSQNQKECVGLLLTDSQREKYTNLIGQQVVVRGTFKSEGCGREGICVEHICGPAIFTDVIISPAS